MDDPRSPFNAGDRVEIVDASHRLHREVGTVDFFVGDNVYVRFPNRRWRSVRMFFPVQLLLVRSGPDAPQDGSEPIG